MSALRVVGRGRRLLLAGLVTLVAGFGLPVAGPADAATDGSLLLQDGFTGSTVPFPAVRGLGDACLTAATEAPPAGISNLGPCTKRTRSPASTIAPGFLQLTDASSNATGGVVVNSPLPADGGLVITFDQFQYGGNGADGIGFFLTDGAVDLTATGAAGGSLGYAQKTGTPGVAGGYLGVGLDAYGNYYNDSEGRGAGCGPTSPWGGSSPQGTASIPKQRDYVVLRGPGNGLQGYCYLAGEKAPVSLRSNNRPTTGADIEALARTVRITVSEADTPRVTVALDPDGRTGAAGMATVFSHQMTTPAPDTYKFGFLGSTGGQTDVHLVRNLTVTSAEPLPPLMLSKQIDDSTVQPTAYAVGTTVPYRLAVTNTTASPLTDVVVTDTRDPVTCPRSTLGAGGTSTATMTCAAEHTVTAADADGRAMLSSTATATGRLPDATLLTSDPATVEVSLAAAASVTLTVSAVLPSGTTAATRGTPVTWLWTVRNNGTTPLSGVAVTPAAGPAPACPVTLAVGASASCTTTAEVSQDDVDAGLLRTEGAATATGAGSAVASPRVAADVPLATPVARLAITGATATIGGRPVAADTGDDVDWTMTLKNQGDVTLSAVGLTVNGVATGLVSCAAAVLAPGRSTTCTTRHRVTAAEVAAGTALRLDAAGSARGPAATRGQPVSTTTVSVPAPLVSTPRAADPDTGTFRASLAAVLAGTGAQVATWVAAASLLLIAGVVLVRVGRRRVPEP